VITLGEIQRIFKGTIRLSEPLAKYSVFGIGGPADYFFAPATREDAARLLQYLHQQQQSFAIVNSGSNVLVSEDGFRGAVVNLDLHLNTIGLTKDAVVIEAGAKVAQLVDCCIQHSIAGTEVLAGISGTLGEWLVGGREIPGSFADMVTTIDVSRGGEKRVLKSDKKKSATALVDSDTDTVLGFAMKRVKGNKPELMKLRREYLLTRNSREPLNVASTGRIFRNPDGTTAAALIEQAKTSLRNIGEAALFERHANYIVTNKHTRSSDVLRLIRRMQDAVRQRSGIELALDLRLLGFEEHTLAAVA
jgi:UDP-N-acetylmuramate dehydrogenase